jgi:uncharacterized membrane protein (DUF106 family)
VGILNATLNRIFDLLLAPLRFLPPLASLAVVSLVTAVAMLLAIGRVSDQRAIDAVKRRIAAGLFEIRLFNDDPRAIFVAQLDILRHNATYLRLSLVPMLWMIVPFVLVIAQLQFHYGYDGVDIDRPVLVTAQLDGQAGNVEGATLDAPSPIRVDTPTTWFPGSRQLIWRVVPTAPGDYALRLRIGGIEIEKTLHASRGFARRSPERLAPGVVNAVLYPSEAPLPSGPVTSINVSYPECDLDVLGWQIHWMIVYFALTIVFAFVLKKPMRVNF